MAVTQVGKDMTVFVYSGVFTNLFASGWKAGLVETASWSVDEGVERYYGAGNRLAQAIVPGPKSISLTLDGLYIDSGAQQYFLGQIEITGTNDIFHVGISGTDRAFRFSGCQIESLDQDNSADGWSRLSVDLAAKSVA